MKSYKKIVLASALAMVAIGATACGKKKTDFKVGVLQYATHDALGKATEGFKDQIQKAVEAQGKTVEFVVENPEGDDTFNTTYATNLVRECDLVLGNATPSAIALKTAAATQGKKDLPILFTSVSDPVAAKLISSMTDPSGNGQITGTSDINPVADQIQMIVDLYGDNCKIGFLYHSKETNSKVQCDAAIAYLQENYPNITTKTSLISEPGDFTTMSRALANDVDAIYVPTDNEIAKNMTAVTNATNPAKTPVFCGESGMVESGGTFTISISYEQLGRMTGDMAVEILLNGKKPNEICPQAQTDRQYFKNAKNDESIRKIELTLPDSFKTKYGF